MEHATIAGNYYLVTSKNGGTVSDATGTLNKLIDAGDQLTVGAPSDKLICDDEEAVIRRVNFKHALAALSLLGGGKSELPMGFQRAEFLETYQVQYGVTQYIDTGVCVKDFGDAFGFETTVYHINHAANYNAHTIVIGVREDSRRQEVELSLYNSGMLRWGTQENSLLGDEYNVFYKYIFKNLELTVFRNGEKTKTASFSPNAVHAPYNLFAFRLNQQGEATYGSLLRMFNLMLFNNEAKIRAFIPALSPTGRPCMYDTVTQQPFYNSGPGEFIVGLTLKQARNFWHKLPTTGGALTVSLPEGYEADAGVAASLARAAERGWVLTLQTYTPEGVAAAASTFALRRVWVRRRADENGTYVAADGSRWQVEWCVDVVGSSPEAEGYEPFRSLEAAVAYWELVPWVDPEAEQAEELLTDQTNGQD